jgi:hypothetical protein
VGHCVGGYSYTVPTVNVVIRFLLGSVFLPVITQLTILFLLGVSSAVEL